jgi:hypothetical protein
MREKPVASMILIIMSFIIGVVIFPTIVSKVFGFEPSSGPVYASADDVSAIQVELGNLRDEVTALQQTVNALSQRPQDTSLNAELAQIDTSLNSLNGRLQRIEHAILDDPTKALEVTLIRRDIDDIEQRYKGDLQSLREDIARLYEFTKWFLGVVILGILGLAASNFLTKRGDTERQ